MKRAIVLLLLASTNAFAQDDKDACVAAADRGQQLRDEAKLIEAREAFLVCAREPCSAVITKTCSQWLREVEGQIPTIAIRARDANGKDVADVTVVIDGTERTSMLDGQPMAVNPGVHAVVYKHAGTPDVSETLVIRVSEKNRPIDVVFQPKSEPLREPPPAVEERHPFRVPASAWISAGIGVAGFGVMAVLAGLASNDASSLRKTCAPDCMPGQVDDVRTKIIGANIALGVGIAGLAAGVLFTIVANVSGSSKKVTADAFRLSF